MGLIELGIMTAMVLFNGVFAGYEIALAAVTIARLQVLARENRAGARAASLETRLAPLGTARLRWASPAAFVLCLAALACLRLI